MYRLIAPYYDLVHQQLQDDLDFILNLADQFGGPVLEMGCGTGRVLLPLIKAGYEVTGLDNEEAMLDKAEKRLEQEPEAVRRRAQLLLADLLQLSLPESQPKAGLVLFTYNTAHHFPAKKLQSILDSIRPQIKKTGGLLLDYANPFVIESVDVEDSPVVENVLTDPSTGTTVVQKSTSHLDFEQQCLHTLWAFEEKGKRSMETDSLTIEIDYWYIFPHQLQLILQRTGFRIEEMLGDYDRVPFSEQSERLLVVAVPAD